MLKFINYVTAVIKIGYDKSADYLGYYASTGNDKSGEINEDCLDDYGDIIDVDEYTDENNNKRIFKKVGLYEEYAWFFGSPSHIIDNIYLGSAFNAASYYDLKERNVKMILNVTKEISEYYPNDFTYYHYDIYDNNIESIGDYLEKAYQDIKSFQRDNVGSNILVHCYMGASRSATIVLYYLMKEMRNEFGGPVTHKEALDYLRSKRPVVNPTHRFTKDLGKSMMIDAPIDGVGEVEN